MSLISRLIGGKMPGGFNLSTIKSYLSKSWRLGSSHSDGVFLLGITLEPPRWLTSKAEGKSWLGISLASPGAAQHVELHALPPTWLTDGEVALDQEKATSLALQVKLDSINHEHGDAYIEGIQPRFDILKACHFDSSWSWVCQDALLMYYDIIFGRLTTIDRKITTRCPP